MQVNQNNLIGNKIYIYIFIFGLLLAFSRFYGVCSSTTIPLFAQFEDPSYFPNDMYVQDSVMGKTTSMYYFLKLFGSMAASTYFAFVLYLITSLAHIYFVYKIAEHLFPNFKEYQFGLIALLMFMYDYPLFSGAYHQLVAVHSFRQTVLGTPFLAAGIYFFLKNRYLLSLSLVSLFALPLHFRSSWFLILVVFSYMILFDRKNKAKVILGSVFLFIFCAVILWWYKSQCVAPPMDFNQRLEIVNIILNRYGNEGAPFRSSVGDLVGLTLFLIPAIYSIRFIQSSENRKKLYYLFAASVGLFVLGGIYTSYLYQSYPSVGLLSLGFPQLVTYPIILSFILLAAWLLKLHVEKNGNITYLFIMGLFILAYFPNNKLKSMIVFGGCILVGYVLSHLNSWLAIKTKLKPLTLWLFISVVLFLGVKDLDRLKEAYQKQSVDFPFYVFEFEKGSYDCQIWSKANTPKDSVFLPLRKIDQTFYVDDAFRKYSGRTVFLGDIANVMYNYELVQEHLKREKFVNKIYNLILSGDNKGLEDAFQAASWRIDYLVVPKEYLVNLPIEFSSSSYVVYKIKR